MGCGVVMNFCLLIIETIRSNQPKDIDPLDLMQGLLERDIIFRWDLGAIHAAVHGHPSPFLTACR